MTSKPHSWFLWLIMAILLSLAGPVTAVAEVSTQIVPAQQDNDDAGHQYSAGDTTADAGTVGIVIGGVALSIFTPGPDELAILGLAGKTVSNLKRAQKVRTVSLHVSQKLCFAAGTLVLMGDGSARPIEHIEPGDQVMCDYDPEADNGPEVCEVADTFHHTARVVLDLTIAQATAQHGNSGGLEEQLWILTTTPDHPFYVPRDREYVPAVNLAAGAKLKKVKNSI